MSFFFKFQVFVASKSHSHKLFELDIMEDLQLRKLSREIRWLTQIKSSRDKHAT